MYDHDSTVELPASKQELPSWMAGIEPLYDKHKEELDKELEEEE